MSQGPEFKVADGRRLLVERIAASSYFSRSARLRDLLVYLTERVAEDEAAEVHEQEVGHKVFGRPRNYDTAADNIVRVHASMLRKRLEQYFAGEGAGEPLVLEIPKGNYAPVFRERSKPAAEPVGLEPLLPGQPRSQKAALDYRLVVAIVCAVLFACSTAILLFLRQAPAPAFARGEVLQRFWGQVLRPDRTTDVVVDDGSVGLYQELTGHPLTLTEYFDRSYLRSVGSIAANAGLDPQMAAAMVLRRQSSFADANFSWKLLQIAGANGMRANLRFARDYSFHDLKANNAILLGNGRSNPWMQSFESKIGVRWQFEAADSVYYPVDTWQSNHSYRSGQPGEAHEGYFSVALLPNLGGAGNVLLLSATGGSATNAAAAFLADERSMSQLRHYLPVARDGSFPPFEALVKARGRNGATSEASVVFCRPAAR